MAGTVLRAPIAAGAIRITGTTRVAGVVRAGEAIAVTVRDAVSAIAGIIVADGRAGWAGSGVCAVGAAAVAGAVLSAPVAAGAVGIAGTTRVAGVVGACVAAAVTFRVAVSAVARVHVADGIAGSALRGVRCPRGAGRVADVAGAGEIVATIAVARAISHVAGAGITDVSRRAIIVL